MSTSNAFWAVVGFIFGIAGNFVYDSTGLRTRAAKLSEGRSRRRITQLERIRATAEELYTDRNKLNSYLISRVLLVTLLWITQEIVDYLLDSASNGSYLTIFDGIEGYYPDVVSTWVNTAASVTSALILAITLNIGIRAYRIWLRVQRFEVEKAAIDRDIFDLKESINQSTSK